MVSKLLVSRALIVLNFYILTSLSSMYSCLT